jgi:hypothetical protein
VADGTDVLPAAAWNKLTNTLDRVLVKLAGLFGAGFFGPDDFAVAAVEGQAALTVSPGGAFIATDLGGLVLASNATPQLFAGLAAGEVAVYVDTSGTAHVVPASDPAPAASRLAGTATVGAGAITSVNPLPAGRINLVGASCVRVDADDQQAGTLADKLTVGDGLALAVEGSGGSRHLVLSLTDAGGTATDEKVKLDAADVAGYLAAKVKAGAGVSVTEKTVDGTRLLEIAATGTDTDTDAKVGLDAADTPGYLPGKLAAGANVTLTEETVEGVRRLKIAAAGGSVGTDELVKLDAGDVAGYLGVKIAAGENVTLTTITDANGNKTLRISAAAGSAGLTTQTVEDSLALSMAIGDVLEVVWDHVAAATFAIPLFTMAWASLASSGGAYAPLVGIRITPLHQSKQGDVTNEHQAVFLVERVS